MSTKISWVLSIVRAPRIPSRVVWRLRETAATLESMSTFRSCDFPALGAPTMAISSRFLSVGGRILGVAVVVSGVEGETKSCDEKYLVS